MVPRLLCLKLAVSLLAIFLAGCAGIVGPASSGGGSADMPAILSAPASQTVITGQAATFTVAASGSAPLGAAMRQVTLGRFRKERVSKPENVAGATKPV